MSLIADKKNIDTSIRYGNGKKDGDQKPWLNKDLVEPVERHTVIAIDYFPLPYMPILWRITQRHKY